MRTEKKAFLFLSLPVPPPPECEEDREASFRLTCNDDDNAFLPIAEPPHGVPSVRVRQGTANAIITNGVAQVEGGRGRLMEGMFVT